MWSQKKTKKLQVSNQEAESVSLKARLQQYGKKNFSQRKNILSFIMCSAIFSTLYPLQVKPLRTYSQGNHNFPDNLPLLLDFHPVAPATKFRV